MLQLVLVILALSAAPVSVAAQDLSEQVVDVLLDAEQALSEGFANSLPQPSSSAGVSYSFDEATGNFQRDPATFGQIYLDRADPLGKRRINVSLVYQFAKLDEVEGIDSTNLGESMPIPFPGLLAALQIPRFDLDVSVHSFLFGFNYGVTDELDVSVVLPLIYSDLDMKARIDAAGITAAGEVITLSEDINDHSRKAGIGDIAVRAKYRVLRYSHLHVSLGMMLRFPSGDEDDLHGKGYYEAAPVMLASSRIYEAAPWARFQGHFNGGVSFNTDEVDASEARWGIGLDWGFSDSVTASIAFLARHPFERIGTKGAFDFPRCNTDLLTCASDPDVRTESGPLLGLSGDREDTYNVSIGARGALWRDTIFALAALTVPVNDAFVKTHPIPLIGIEATF